MTRFFQSLLIVFGLFAFSTASAQVVVDNTFTPEQLVQDILVGQGVVVTNITFTGSADQIGYFDATNSAFPIPTGIVMSTGDVNEVPGPGTYFSSSGQGGAGDADMTTISGFNTNDAAILQFDFVPTGDSVSFAFSFGSEEYPNFVNSINDAFAFIISGPGFNGPYINNGENIALIPGTTLPVTIDNVNDVIPANAQYYVNNENGPADGIVFNGYTTSILAEAEVQCGETYTLRFVIADASDAIYDSGVFLEANSFNSNAVSVNISTASGNIEDGGGWIVENCTPAEIIFERPATAVDTAIAVPIEITGSATNGVDYVGVPDTVYFGIGDTTVSFTLEALQDAFLEPSDSIVLTVTTLNLCGDPVVSTGTIHIYDFGFYTYDLEAIEDQTVECAGDSVLITAVASLGNPEYVYSWNNGVMGDSLWVTPSADSLLIVSSYDACGTNSNQDTVLINYAVNPNPMVSVSGSNTFDCVPEDVLLTANGSQGNSPYVYIWNTGSGSATINPTLSTDTAFSVIAIDQCGVQSEPDTFYITQNPVSIPTVSTSLDVVLDCPGETATLTAIASGGVQPYEYSWSVTNETTSTITVQPAQTTEYVITVTDDCYVGEVTDTILVTVEVHDPLSVTVDDASVLCPGDLVTLSSVVDGGNDPFTYSWTSGSNTSSESLNPNTTTNVTLTVTDDCGESTSDDATVDVPVYDALAALVTNEDLIDGDTITICEFWADTAGALVSGGLAPYEYTWSGTLIEGSINNDSAIMVVNYELPPDSSVYELYSLRVVDQCMEEVTTEFHVEVISCDVTASSIFNPESDFVGTSDFCGNPIQNNVFGLPCLNLYPGNTVTIWDRWGRKLYKTDNYHLAPWNGGNNATGTYFYVCELPGDKEPVKGYFQLVR